MVREWKVGDVLRDRESVGEPVVVVEVWPVDHENPLLAGMPRLVMVVYGNARGCIRETWPATVVGFPDGIRADGARNTARKLWRDRWFS
jgi:hypothetical protein